MTAKDRTLKHRAEAVLENFVVYRVVRVGDGVPKTLQTEYTFFHEAEAAAMTMQKADGADYGVARQETRGVLLYIEKGG